MARKKYVNAVSSPELSARLGVPVFEDPDMNAFLRGEINPTRIYVSPLLARDAEAREAVVDWYRTRGRAEASHLKHIAEKLFNAVRVESGQCVNKPKPGKPRGNAYDLTQLQRDAAARHPHIFPGWKPIAIRWGRLATGSKHSVRLGYYDPTTCQITVNKLLDHDVVPREAVEFVVYHEMLHHQIPTTASRGGQEEHHPPEFRRLEALYDGIEASKKWRAEGLQALIRQKATPGS